MSLEEARSMYDALLQSGELGELFPGMSGEWKQDKAKFYSLYELNEQSINFDGYLDLDDDYNEFY